jgi:hypothetical protein
MNNRVLTLADVLALPEGAKVWVEVRNDSYYSGIHFRNKGKLVDSKGKFTIGGPGHVGGSFRVWSLPQPPTDEELAANPWTEGGQQ